MDGKCDDSSFFSLFSFRQTHTHIHIHGPGRGGWNREFVENVDQEKEKKLRNESVNRLVAWPRERVHRFRWEPTRQFIVARDCVLSVFSVKFLLEGAWCVEIGKKYTHTEKGIKESSATLQTSPFLPLFFPLLTQHARCQPSIEHVSARKMRWLSMNVQKCV